MISASHVRQQFLDFFASKGHVIVPSAPIVVKDDPTLLFTNSGMAPFKDYFLGNKTAPNKRVADTQKCLRVSGKHNDLEEVGYDTYHHTMFEMLGNWSFGDYFKTEAIAWAWELLTEVYKLPKDRLYVTYFEGDAAENLAADTETQTLWRQYTTDDRILPGNKKDNFWEMGDTGPCGPCTEIHIDLRDESEIAEKSGRELVNADHPQVVEIWNNVFMEFQRMADKSLVKLPAQHVDTGMGFERLMMAVSGVKSNYDTDVFQPLIQFIAKAANVEYGGTQPSAGGNSSQQKTDIAIRVIADHIRAIAFTIADGQLPSNVKAGYVIRRILRRAVRYAFTFLNFKTPFLHTLVPVLAEQMRSIFPELRAQEEFVSRVILEEEIAFLRTLESGLRRLEEVMGDQAGGQIDGATAFQLSDTFGFPLDLTELIARENGFSVDTEGFARALEAQKNRSRKAAEQAQGDWVVVRESAELPVFTGYDELTTTANLMRYRAVTTKEKKQEYHVVLDRTPFYAESGGQIGDTGFLESELSQVRVTDTRKENDLIIHVVHELPMDVEAVITARVDEVRRRMIQRHHSATHLLHAALREVLGTHVAQRGSLVSEKLLRFDFSHFQKVTDAQLREVERLVNQRIRQQIPLQEERAVPVAEAKSRGAMALFGEKYGEVVRVITFDKDYSVELCGGTHVPNTGEIGFAKITAESAVGAGVRRIEAVTADLAEAYVNEQLGLLDQVREALNNPQHLLTAVQKNADEIAALRKLLEAAEAQQIAALRTQLAGEVQPLNGVNFLAKRVSVGSAEGLKTLAFQLRQSTENLVLVLGAEIDGKPQLAVMLDDELAKSGRFNATQMIRELAKEIQGGGGGQPFFATAGGKNVAGLDAAIAKAAGLVSA
jgi:alanyl-tRNA synthetase